MGVCVLLSVECAVRVCVKAREKRRSCLQQSGCVCAPSSLCLSLVRVCAACASAEEMKWAVQKAPLNSHSAVDLCENVLYVCAHII